jgi:hypothetical protein
VGGGGIWGGGVWEAILEVILSHASEIVEGRHPTPRATTALGVALFGGMAAVFEPEPAPEGASEVVLIPSKDDQPREGEVEEDELFGDDAPMTIQPENDEGNQEYKLQLINPSPERFVHLVTQCQFRVSEGEPSRAKPLACAAQAAMRAFFFHVPAV